MKLIRSQILILLSAMILLSSCEKERDDVSAPPAAKANNTEVVQLPKDSIALTGTGTSENKIVGYLWSQVSGPGVATIVSPSASSTVIRGLKVGEYIFQFVVIDDLGLTGVDTVSVKVIPSQVITLTLQPKSNSGEMTIAGNTFSIDLSDPQSTELAGAAWTYNGDVYGVRGLIKFDLTSIPQNATIISAKFSIFSHPKPLNGDHINANSGSDNAFLIQRVTSVWIPSQVNWKNQPTTVTTAQIEIPKTSKPFLDIPDIDVTNLLSEMVSSNKNYGFMMRMKNDEMYSCRIFCSSKFTDASKHPKLVINYKIN